MFYAEKKKIIIFSYHRLMANKNISFSDAGISNYTTQHQDGGRSCFIAGVSQLLQRDYFYYTNVVLSPVITL